MHAKLLAGMRGHLVHRHHGAPHGKARTGPDGFGLDQELVGELSAGTIGAEDEARLAQEVAELLPRDWDLPNKPQEALRHVRADMGGHDELIQWLDRYPGLPQLTARIYVLLGLLDHYGDAPAVVGALKASRAHEPYPAGLHDFLLPQTNEDTLSDLGFQVEEFLSEKERQRATELAMATADWVRQSLTTSGTADAEPYGLADLMGHVRADIGEAAAART